MDFDEMFPLDFRLGQKELVLYLADLNDLMELWEKSRREKRELVTCRPVWAADSVEARKLFLRKLEEPGLRFFKIMVNGRIAGRISLADHNPRNRSAELGFSLLPEFRGQGYMRRALTLLTAYLFEKTDINKVYAQTAGFNRASIRLLERLGFSQDACLREHHEWEGALYPDLIFSLLRADYENRD